MTYKRKEIIGDCTLYLGDCLEVMPTLDKVDAVVTDPPYGIEEKVGGYGRGGKHKIKNDRDLSVCHAALNLTGEIYDDIRVLAFYSCKVTQEFYNGVTSLDFFGDIVWDKKVPGLGENFRYQHENISIFTKGTPPPIGKGFSVLSYIRNPEQHPHQKPVELMKELIGISGGNKILDPFMGSGSTGVACVKLGRKFIGIELEEKYFDIACKRIEEAYKQPDLFIEAAKVPEQEVLL